MTFQARQVVGHLRDDLVAVVAVVHAAPGRVGPAVVLAIADT